jgi:hypothetical protein
VLSLDRPWCERAAACLSSQFPSRPNSGKVVSLKSLPAQFLAIYVIHVSAISERRSSLETRHDHQLTQSVSPHPIEHS